MYRYDWIRRWIVPAGNDEEYAHQNNSRRSLHRKVSGFDFQKVFPKTYAMLCSGKKRWFQYKKDVLRVIIGQGKGSHKRHFESKQVLKTWKHNFESFHELLCLVGASWMWNGKELKADDSIEGIDDDCSVLSSRIQLDKLVTCLAMAEDPDGRAILYSGHNDGTLTKWSLEDKTEIWTKQII
eukprot:CCRYP_018927-RB/>CCRYP_018927-RB protein AED:0.44 eAED:0.44 QI:0/0/0/1/0/0/3/0/181